MEYGIFLVLQAYETIRNDSVCRFESMLYSNLSSIRSRVGWKIFTCKHFFDMRLLLFSTVYKIFQPPPRQKNNGPSIRNYLEPKRD